MYEFYHKILKNVKYSLRLFHNFIPYISRFSQSYLQQKTQLTHE